MKYIGYIATFLAYLSLSACWNGYVLSVLWGWFIVERFPGAPVLSIPSALGIAMTVRFLTYQEPAEKPNKTTTERLIEAGIHAFLQPLVALAFGAIVRMFL